MVGQFRGSSGRLIFANVRLNECFIEARRSHAGRGRPTRGSRRGAVSSDFQGCVVTIGWYGSILATAWCGGIHAILRAAVGSPSRTHDGRVIVFRMNRSAASETRQLIVRIRESANNALRLKNQVAGCGENMPRATRALPTDLSHQHDHYLLRRSTRKTVIRPTSPTLTCGCFIEQTRPASRAAVGGVSTSLDRKPRSYDGSGLMLWGMRGTRWRKQKTRRIAAKATAVVTRYANRSRGRLLPAGRMAAVRSVTSTVRQGLSLTDCLSFTLMDRNRSQKHYIIIIKNRSPLRQAGFSPRLPRIPTKRTDNGV